MRVAIVGAGAVGRSIASELLHNGHSVMLIEKEARKVRTRSVPGAASSPRSRRRSWPPATS
jgi:trk system potassium uptake protein TrkA